MPKPKHQQLKRNSSKESELSNIPQNMALRFHLLSLYSVLCLCVAHSTTVLAQQEFFPFLAESTGDRVNVRAGQSANFERLCQLKKGEEVVVLEREYSWYKIQLPPRAKAFVSKNYVQYLGQNAGGVTADKVNIRAGAGTHHTILGQLTKGEQIYIQEDLEDWYRIQPVKESYGWVADIYLTFKSNDILEYQESIFTKPVISENLIEQEEPEEPAEQKKNEQTVKKEYEKSFSAIGYVEDYEDADKDNIHYKIVQKGRPVCYVQGKNHMLNRFMHYKVSVEGTVNKKLQSKYAYPVIIVTKVKLML